MLVCISTDGAAWEASVASASINPAANLDIFFNSIMAIIGSLQVFTQGYIMTEGGPGNSSLFYVYYIYREGFQNANMGYACALACFLFALMYLANKLVTFALGRVGT